MWPKDRWVSGEVVKVVHDDGNKEVQHNEGTQEDEGDKVDVGQRWATILVGINQITSGLVKF